MGLHPLQAGQDGEGGRELLREGKTAAEHRNHILVLPQGQVDLLDKDGILSQAVENPRGQNQQEILGRQNIVPEDLRKLPGLIVEAFDIP